MGIVFILVRKKKGGGALILKIRLKCHVPLTKVIIINFDYDHNLHQFECFYFIKTVYKLFDNPWYVDYRYL